MGGKGTLEMRTLPMAFTFFLSQSLGMMTIGTSFESLADCMRRANKHIKKEADNWRQIQEIIPLFTTELVHFLTDSIPQSMLPHFPPAVVNPSPFGGASTLYGRPAPKYDQVPDVDEE